MIVKNEAHNLEDCIKPLTGVLDEIIVVDTGSKDQTREVAKSLGAKVFNFTWCDDFAAARNESIRHATGDYIFWLDADDRMDVREVKKLSQLKERFPQKKDEAYFLIVSNPSLVDGGTLFRQLRIFPKVKGAFFEGRIHEQIFHRLQSLGVKRVDTDIQILHQGYHGPEEVMQKSLRNLSLIKNALETEPENLFLHYQAARTLAGLSRFTDAVEHMEKVISHPKVRAEEKRFCFDASLLLAQWYMEMNRYEEAFRVLNVADELDEINPLIHFYKGDLFYRVGDYKSAIKETLAFLEKPFEVGIIPINSDWLHHYPYHLLWQCYLKRGELSMANEMFQTLFSQPRTHTKCLEELGLRCLKEGQFHEAAIYYQKAIEEKSATDTNYANLGLALWKAGRTDEARRALEKALELNPERLEALTHLGHLCYQQKEDLKALDYLNRALFLKPDLIDVRLLLSELYFRSYDPDGLIEQCDQLLKILSLPRNITVESLNDVSKLYETIGETLLVQRQGHLALMAFGLSFLLHPSRERMEGLVEKAKEQGKLESAFKQIEKALVFHGMTSTGMVDMKRLPPSAPTMDKI